jgi:cell pole-organizing protein PopZ
MPNSDKAAEPTMDEILASIRKIISEDPEGSDTEPAKEQPAKRATEPSTAGAIWSSGGIGPDDDLSDILDHPAGPTPEGAGPQGQSEPPSTRGPNRPPAPQSRPTFGQRSAPPPIDVTGAASPPPAPPAQSKPGEVSDSPFGLPLPVQPMSGDGPPAAAPPLPLPLAPEPGPAPTLRRPDAAKPPPPVGSSSAPITPPRASAPVAPPPEPVPVAPPPKAEATAPSPKSNAPALPLKSAPAGSDQAEKPSIGFTLADRLRNFGLDGDSDDADGNQMVGEPPVAVSEEREKLEQRDAQEKPEKQEKPVPFAMRAARIDAPDDEAAADLEDEPAPEAPEVAVKFAAVLGEDDALKPAAPDTTAATADKPAAQPAATPEPLTPESFFGSPPRRADDAPKPDTPPERVDPVARENAIRRGIFGMPELAEKKPADDGKAPPVAEEKAAKVEAPPPFAGFDEPIGKRALDILAEPSPAIEPSQPSQPASPAPEFSLPIKADAADEVGDKPIAGAGPAMPLTAAAVAPVDEAAPETGSESVVGSAGAQSASPPPSDEAAAPGAEEHGQGAGGRSLEDTVSALLRPMLRDWLDNNMPGIVEKALKGELAGREADPSKSNAAKDSDD